MNKIFTITSNPTFDVHINVENFRQGKENYAYGRSRQAGGKGVNLSRALANCGVENTALVLVGRESREEFEKCLCSDGVRFIAEYATGKVRENITIHSGAEETRISLEGTGITDGDMGRIFDVAEKLCGDGDFLVFSGRVPQGLDRKRICEKLKAFASSGAKLCVDSNSFERSEIAFISPWLIKPNRDELAALCGMPVDSVAGAFRFAEELTRDGVENVLVSLGESGAMLVGSDGGRLVARPQAIVAVSTIGAGDSMLAGFISSMAESDDKGRALASAVAWGTAKCLREGTLPPFPEDIERIRPTVTVEKS